MLLGVAIATALLVPAVSDAAKTPNELLRERPFAPTERKLFSTDVYPNTPAMEPAEGTPLTESQGRAALKRYLKDEYPSDKAKREAGLRVYGNATAERKIPDPQLRAAFAALKGTFAAPAIKYFLHAKTKAGIPLFLQAGYGGGFPAIASVASTANPDQKQVFFNSRYQYENPFLLTSTWAHEPLHGEGGASLDEEGVASSFTHLLNLRQLVRHPELARSGTELARFRNTQTLARLNSGRGAHLGLYKSNGNRFLFADSSSFTGTGWWDFLLELYSHTGQQRGITPGDSLLKQYLTNTHEAGAPRCSGKEYSQETLDCIDANGNGGLRPGDLVAAARALKLKVK